MGGEKVKFMLKNTWHVSLQLITAIITISVLSSFIVGALLPTH